MQSDVFPLIIVKQSFLYHCLEVLVSCHMKNEKSTGFISQDFLVPLSSLFNSDLLIIFFRNYHRYGPLETTIDTGLYQKRG